MKKYEEERFVLNEEDIILLNSGKCIKAYGDNGCMIIVPPNEKKELF